MQYLEAMGVDMYVPRFVLPAAKAPSLCALPVAPSHVEPTTKIHDVLASAGDTALSTPAPEHVSAPEVVADVPRPAITSEAPANDTVAEVVDGVVDVVTEQSVSFSLSMWRVGDVFQVIDSRRPHDALPTHALLNNILRAVMGAPAQLPESEIIHWPLVQPETDGPVRDQGWSAAHQMVGGFLEGRLAATPVKYLLLFGQEAAKAVLGADLDTEDSLYCARALEDFDATAILLPSLADILYVAQLKPKVWEALISVKSTLTSSQ